MPAAPSPPRSITVVAAVIRDPDDRILLARRPRDRHMGGLWEFPGGKIAPGEPPETALKRELLEELGITVDIEHPLTFAHHEEPGLHILLLFYAARIVDGEPTAREGQDLEWVPPSDLHRYPTPPADAELIVALAGAES